MAIKGKKKSQSRGSQGVRRPASAPRPVTTARRKTSWWRTRDGLLIGGIFVLVAIGVVVWLIVSAQDRAKELEAEQADLEQYTTALQPALDSLAPPVQEMIAVAAVPAEEDLDALAEDAEGWMTDIQTAQAVVQQQFVPEEIQPINDLIAESMSLYITAAQTFQMLPDAEGDLRDELFARATQARDSAGSVMTGAIATLDSFRREKEIGASGLRSPANLPAPAPSTAPTPEAEGSPLDSETTGGEGGKKDGKKSNGKDDASGG
jgi:hypothetical protein